MAEPANDTRDLSASVAGRNQVTLLAYTQPDEAMRVADEIPDPWYAAQAFATVARYAQPGLREAAFDRTRAAAAEGKDDYQRAAVLAWPIRAALEVGVPDLAKTMLDDAEKLLPHIALICSRADAMGLLFAAAHPGGARLWRGLLACMPVLCPPDTHWRAARLYRDVVHMLADQNGNLVEPFIARMPAGKTRARAERDWAKRIRHPPRPFFAQQRG